MNFTLKASDKIALYIKSFFILFALMRLFHIETTDFFSLLFYISICFILHKSDLYLKDFSISKFSKKIFVIGSIIFSTFVMLYNYSSILNGLSSKLFCLIIISFSLIGIVFLFYYFFSTIMIFLSTKILFQNNNTSKMLKLPAQYITFGACLLFWGPYLLFNFPGVMTPDSINQYAQIIGVYAQSNHHPWIHTQLIHLFYNIGLLFTHTPTYAIAFYTIFQLLFMAFVAAYVMNYLLHFNFKNYVYYLVFFFYVLVPYHGTSNVTIWKDIPFAGAFTLFLCSISQMFIPLKNNTKQTLFDFAKITYFLSGIMICLFRTNGWYVFLLTLPFLIYFSKDQIMQSLLLNVTIILVVLIIKIPVMNTFQVVQPDFAESISIPMQQIARVYSCSGNISNDETEFLSNFLDTSQLSTNYQESVSDPIKYLIREGNPTYLAQHKFEFFRIWFHLGIKNPKIYLDAFINQTNGYWYPTTPCEIGLNEGIYDNDFGLSWSPILKGNLFIKLKEIIFKLYTMIPLYGLLWSMGTIFWTIIFFFLFCIKKNEPQKCLIFLPAIFLVATLCLATPVASEFRYVYSLFYSLPLFIILPFTK